MLLAALNFESIANPAFEGEPPEGTLSISLRVVRKRIIKTAIAQVTLRHAGLDKPALHLMRVHPVRAWISAAHYPGPDSWPDLQL